MANTPDAGALQVQGLARLRRTLRAAGDDLADFTQVNTAAARIAATAVRGRVARRTGALAASIRSSGTKTAGFIRAGYATVPYANPIHWGWFARHIKPHPFLSEVAQRSQPVWVPLYERYLDSLVNKVEGI